ncbi:unnamed protein product [Rhizophagus irregularis]|nr:unnamed protein product [Rhizophagus irregularis]
MSLKNVQVIVGIDFGTTFSGFSYCHILSRDNIVTNDKWDEITGQFKTNTVLQYDDEFEVIKWGIPALAKRQGRRNDNTETQPAITDYLREMGKLIKERIECHWEDLNIFEEVLFVLTVPAEYSEKEKAIMRDCAYKAGLINVKSTDLLQFTTEPEAAAVYCMEHCLKEHDLGDTDSTETTFMIVDCGGGTVDLTTRKIVGRSVGEITERSGLYDNVNNIDSENVRLKLTTRKLKFTYGIKIFDTWKKSDPKERKTPKGEIIRFLPIEGATKGKEVKIDEDVIVDNLLGPNNPFQTAATFHVYYTREANAKYCDEPGMEYLGKLKINLPDVHLGYNRPLKFGLSFGRMEIKATARYTINGQSRLKTFDIDIEDD